MKQYLIITASILTALLIAGVVVWGILSHKAAVEAEKARLEKAHEQLRSLEKSIDAYEFDTGTLPSDLRSLLSSTNPKANVPYPAASIVLDPWGTHWMYDRMNNTEYTIISAGPDRKHGTPDDVK